MTTTPNPRIHSTGIMFKAVVYLFLGYTVTEDTPVTFYHKDIDVAKAWIAKTSLKGLGYAGHTLHSATAPDQFCLLPHLNAGKTSWDLVEENTI